MEITLQDSLEFINNESVQKLLDELESSYLSIALTASSEQHEKRLEALTAVRVLKDFNKRMSEPANRK